MSAHPPFTFVHSEAGLGNLAGPVPFTFKVSFWSTMAHIFGQSALVEWASTPGFNDDPGTNECHNSVLYD